MIYQWLESNETTTFGGKLTLVVIFWAELFDRVLPTHYM